jgi:ribonuclease HI
MPTKIYTDGSCMPNPGSGGWAFIILYEDNPIEWWVSGGDDETTNNRMELTAVIESLEFVNKKSCDIYSDSKYVINCAQKKWKRKTNTDLWDYYDKISKGIKINWIWVKGHSGDKYNEAVDYLAKQEVKTKK